MSLPNAIKRLKNTKNLTKYGWSVYRHILPNNKVYIGETSNKPEKRWNRGNGYKNNKQFYADIIKYGWDNIQHDILIVVDNIYDALLYEYCYILKNKSYLCEYGYNRESTDIIYFLHFLGIPENDEYSRSIVKNRIKELLQTI